MNSNPTPPAPAPGPEADPAARSGPAEAERRARQTMEENALEQQLEISHAHEDALAENRKRKQEADKKRHQASIEARITGDDVQTLNDRAMFEVYGSEVPVVRKTEKDKPTRRNLEDGNEVFEKGSKGVKDTAPKKHKYEKGKASYTVLDPETGEVIGSPERPLKGKLEDIETNPRYGKTQAERKKAAKTYEKDLLSLIEDEGLEFSQAKLIMDMRESDREMQIRFASELEIGGMSRGEAGRKAKEVYKDKDAERLDIIKTEGAFTGREYEHVRKGGDLYKGPVTYKDLQDREEPTKEMDHEGDVDSREAFYIEEPDDIINGARYRAKNATTPEERKQARDEVVRAKRAKNAMTNTQLNDLRTFNREGKELLHDLGNALNNYASLQAVFEEKSSSYGDKKREKARQELEEARQQYEILRREANNRTGRFLLDNGFNNEEVSEELLRQDAGMYAKPSHGTYSNGVGEEVRRGEAGLVRDVTRQEKEEQMKEGRRKKESRFVKWWMEKVRKKEIETEEIHLDVDELRDTRRVANQRHIAQLNRIGDVEEMLKAARENDDRIYQAYEVTDAHFNGATADKKSNKNKRKS